MRFLKKEVKQLKHNLQNDTEDPQDKLDELPTKNQSHSSQATLHKPEDVSSPNNPTFNIIQINQPNDSSTSPTKSYKVPSSNTRDYPTAHFDPLQTRASSSDSDDEKEIDLLTPVPSNTHPGMNNIIQTQHTSQQHLWHQHQPPQTLQQSDPFDQIANRRKWQ